MADLKPPGAQGLHGHALRDFYRGAMTKNLVKGADGGARGVDFQDLEGENKDKEANKAKGGSSNSSSTKRRSPSQEKQAQDSSQTPDNILQEMLAANQQARVEGTVQDVESQEQQKQKKKLVTQQAREDAQQDSEHTDDATSELLAEPNDQAHQASILQSISKLLADPTTERRAFGAMALTDPELMKKTLGSPVRVAKHLLVLSSRMVEMGRPREDVLAYLTQTFLALGPDFGKRSFRDFSVNIGIGTFYPLEIRERILQANESFLPTLKCRFTSTRRMLAAKVKEMIVLEYPEDMTITEFAVKGGTRKGYVLAPLKEKGKHGLRFFEPGEYKVLIMGHDAMHFERMEEIKLEISGEPTAKATPDANRPAAKFSFDRLKRSREAQQLKDKPPGEG